jgi:hypothetical protein
MVILLALVSGTAFLRLVIWLATKTTAREIIGACMEDKRVVTRQEIVCDFSPPGPQFLHPSTDGHDAEQEHRKKKSRMSSHSMRDASSLRDALRRVSVID